MQDDTTTTKKAEVKASSKVSIKVTSAKTVDFPSLGWGIHAGEILDLPEDAEARAVILSNSNITTIK